MLIVLEKGISRNVILDETTSLPELLSNRDSKRKRLAKEMNVSTGRPILSAVDRAFPGVLLFTHIQKFQWKYYQIRCENILRGFALEGRIEGREKQNGKIKNIQHRVFANDHPLNY